MRKWCLPGFGRAATAPELKPASKPAPENVEVDINDLPVDDEGRPLLSWPADWATLRQVGMANLAMVAEHHIEHCFNSVSHHIRLTNGGVINFAYALDGRLLELSAEQVKIVAENNGTLLFDAIPAVSVAVDG